MNISIPKDKTPEGKYTKEAKDEIKKQVVDFVGKVCDEAERMETSRVKDVNNVQITPHSIQRAVRYVIEERVEVKKNPKFIDLVCPSIMGIITILIGIVPYIDFIKQKLLWIIVPLFFLYSIFLVIQLTYNMKK